MPHYSKKKITFSKQNESSLNTLRLIHHLFRFRLFPNVVEGIVSAVCDAEKQEGQKQEETTYLKAVHDTGAFFSSIIRKESSRFFDLRTVAALLLTLRGLRKVVFMGQRPSGPQMLWWALSLLRGR